jgi:hypothetical protein
VLPSAARIALIAALLVGVVAMHTFGHGEHHEAEAAHAVASTTAHDHNLHAMPSGATDEEPLPVETLFSVMICGAVLLRLAFGLFRSIAWSRLTASVLAVVAADAGARSAAHPPPLRVRPTGVSLNRVAVLRI